MYKNGIARIGSTKEKAAASPPKIIKIGIVQRTSGFTISPINEYDEKTKTIIGSVVICAEVVVEKSSKRKNFRPNFTLSKNGFIKRIPMVAMNDN